MIRRLDARQMESIRTEVRRFNVGKHNHQYLRRKLAHNLATHEESEFVPRGGTASPHETGDGALNAAPHPGIELIGGVKNIPSQPFVVAPFHCALQLCLHLAPIGHVSGSSRSE